jgi:hypothetical protein
MTNLSICSAQKLNDRRCRNKSKTNSICHYHRYHPYKFKLNMKLKHQEKDQDKHQEKVDPIHFEFMNKTQSSLKIFRVTFLASLFFTVMCFNLFTIAYIISDYNFDKTIESIVSIKVSPIHKETFDAFYKTLFQNYDYLQGVLFQNYVYLQVVLFQNYDYLQGVLFQNYDYLQGVLFQNYDYLQGVLLEYFLDKV